MAIIFIIHSFIFSDKVWLEKVKTADKLNGIMIQLEMDNFLDENNITAWQAKSDWFYITLFKTFTDTNNLILTTESKEIRQFQPIMNQESIQLGFHLRNKIEYFDIQQDRSNNIAFVTLHYPKTHLYDLVELNQEALNKTSINSRNSVYKWSYIAGLTLIANGLINQNNHNNWQTHTGIAIVFISALTKILFN